MNEYMCIFWMLASVICAPMLVLSWLRVRYLIKFKEEKEGKDD